MHDNYYYNIDSNDPNIAKIMSFCTGFLEQQTFSLDKSKVIVKLCKHDDTMHPELDGYIRYDHEGIKEIINGPEYLKTE
jgi:hypothetical protein